MYTLLIEYRSGTVVLANGENGKYIVAREENKHLLNEIGNKLVKENIIVAYQLVKLIGDRIDLQVLYDDGLAG